MKVTIKRSMWLRGQGSSVSALLTKYAMGADHRRKMCCLGFTMLKAGYTKRQILGKSTPSELLYGKRRIRAVIEGLFTRYTSSSKKLNGTINGHSIECVEMMSVNDSTHMQDAEREERLTRVAREIGIEFVFVD